MSQRAAASVRSNLNLPYSGRTLPINTKVGAATGLPLMYDSLPTG